MSEATYCEIGDETSENLSAVEITERTLEIFKGTSKSLLQNITCFDLFQSFLILLTLPI